MYRKEKGKEEQKKTTPITNIPTTTTNKSGNVNTKVCKESLQYEGGEKDICV